MCIRSLFYSIKVRLQNHFFLSFKFNLICNWIELNKIENQFSTIDWFSVTHEKVKTTGSCIRNSRDKRRRTKLFFVCASLKRFISILDWNMHLRLSFYFNFVSFCERFHIHIADSKSYKYVKVCVALCAVLFGGIRTQSKCLKKSSLCIAYTACGTGRLRVNIWIWLLRSATNDFNFKLNKIDD